MGSGYPAGINKLSGGEFTPESAVSSIIITHNLGGQCKGIVIWLNNIGAKDSNKTNIITQICANLFNAALVSGNQLQITGKYVGTGGNLLGISKQDSGGYSTSTTIQLRNLGAYFNPTLVDPRGNEAAAVYKWIAWR